jgi:antirestriction protein ArdC
MNNKWLTLKQANDLDGQVLKGSKGTAVPYSSKAYSYKRPNGKTFKINAWSREEADAEAFKKDKAAKYESEYFFYRYYTVYNVEQTTLASEFTATPGYQAVSDSAKARALVEARLDDKRDFTERKLLILLGASFMTATKPNKDEMVLYQAWLSRLNEKPTFLYTLSTEAGRIVDEILEDIKAGRVAA